MIFLYYTIIFVTWKVGKLSKKSHASHYYGINQIKSFDVYKLEKLDKSYQTNILRAFLYIRRY